VPLLGGVAVYTVSSLLCAAAPTIETLVVLRLVQGLAGGAGIAIARAIVRDRYDDPAEASRAFSLLVLIGGLAPVLAPTIGGAVLHVSDWRGVFVVLGAIGLFLLVAAWRWIPDTLAPQLRHRGGLITTGRALRTLVRDRRFVGLALAGALGFAALSAYIAGSPFVLEEHYGVSPSVFALIFGLNAMGLVAASQLSRMLVGRATPEALLIGGQLVQIAGAVIVLVVVAVDGPLGGVLAGLFLIVSATGIIAPNATTLAMIDHPEAAGSASGLLGLTMFGMGALVAPLPGVAGATGLPMALVMISVAVAGAVALRTLR
jgi:DHA1 family bicyclomycin/chloramphenicol resistance-like MFS transporter